MKLFESSALCSLLLGIATLGHLVSAADKPWTSIHEKGRCAIRGQCGKQSFFAGELPCPDNGKAEEADDTLRQKLVKTCGNKWAEGPVCCTEDQVDALASKLSTVNGIVASCPACKENFFNLFCTFTCSPDQSLFLNVTDMEPKGDKYMTTELDNLWSDEYGSIFYDSCKDVKFGAANARAMSFIGGGAKNYTDFLKFLGKKSPPLGSPFQINFPRPDSAEFPSMAPAATNAHPCNTTDQDLRCSCVDCASSCPELPKVETVEHCHVGAWPCLSFAVVLIYAITLVLLAAAVSSHVVYRKHTASKNQRLRLLQDTAASDDEDEDELAYQMTPTPKGPTRKYWLNTICDRLFNHLGRTCARFPALTISSSLVVVALLSLGWVRFDIETDPVRLWVAPDSAAAEEKAFFDSNFGPFFRAEQAFLVNDTSPAGPGPVLSYDTLRWWFDVEKRVERLTSRYQSVTLDEVCYKPTGKVCVVQSLTGYFDGDFSNVDPDLWQDDLQDCVNDPTSCLPAFGLPLDPKLILGGVTNASYIEAEALIVTWVVSNHQEGTQEIALAMEWEDDLNNLLKSVQWEAQERGLRLSFNTEISLEQELNKSTNTDAKIVVISYIVMFIYASLALGSTTLAVGQILRNPTSALVQSKFMLGVVGIVIVLLSVSASVGLFSAAGIKVTLIIAEVIPFLVLAVGVDNIFLIVHEFERVNISHPDDLIEDRMARALGRMGPSILLSATTETIAFALGAFVGMPAVRNFAAYAAGAVVINALLQVTAFVSTLALNQRRVEAGRADCIPCIRVRPAVGLYEDGAMEDDGLQKFIRRTYAPALLGKKAKVAVVTIFLGLFTAGLALIPTIQLGLDQRVAIPDGSYLIDYFNDLYDYFDSGPPVYFVTRELNVTERVHQQQLCGRFTTCDEFSLSNILEQERKRPEISYIADPTASWVDDFFLWLNPELDCCFDREGDKCFEHRSPKWSLTMSGMPEGQEYIHYLKRWLGATTDADCTLGGQAGYSSAVVLDRKGLTIPASHFRTSHTPLRSQDDFIAAYASARRISSAIEQANPGVSVFPYSKFYIFFDQYADIVRLTLTLLGAAIAACFVVSSVLLGSVRTGLVVAATVIMTLVDIAGAIAVAGVSLNAVTLVNLVICVGIAVEFCAHIARAFQFPPARQLADALLAAPSPDVSLLSRNKPRRTTPARSVGAFPAAAGNSNPALAAGSSSGASRTARAGAALAAVGASVFSGITLTKLLGVAVLAFTRSKIFEIYYFRVWLALVVFGAAHALVFLPVALSLLGGKEGWVGDEGRGGLADDLRRRVRGGADWEDDDEYSDDE